MCGPADFEALHTCVTRLAELSAAGLATYSVRQTVALYHARRRKSPRLNNNDRRKRPGKLAAEGSGADANP